MKKIDERTIEFASQVIVAVRSIGRDDASNALIKQIVRSCSSPALNYVEAQMASSIRDFIHKMRIALKELKETQVNLKIMYKCGYISESEFRNLISENNELVSIFVASIKTASKSLSTK